MRESRGGSQIGTKKTKQKERKAIVNSYRSKSRKKNQHVNPNSYEAKMRAPMQSEMNVNNMNGTDDLVSSLSGLSIAKKDKKNRNGRKSQICGGGVQS